MVQLTYKLGAYKAR